MGNKDTFLAILTEDGPKFKTYLNRDTTWKDDMYEWMRTWGSTPRQKGIDDFLHTLGYYPVIVDGRLNSQRRNNVTLGTPDCGSLLLQPGLRSRAVDVGSNDRVVAYVSTPSPLCPDHGILRGALEWSLETGCMSPREHTFPDNRS